MAHVIRFSVFAAFVAAASIAACANGTTEVMPQFNDPDIVRAPGTIALTNVHVRSMVNDQRADNQTVVVRDGRIVSIASSASATIPPDATTIDGRGRVLMPALIDMHVHLRRAELASYLKAGVTTVRNMWGHTEIPNFRLGIQDGSLNGPTIHSLSNGFDANPPQWPQTRLVLDARDAEAAVAAAIGEGWTALKVYQRLSLSVYDSIVASARRHGVAFAGHVPTAVTVEHALASGQRSIEHLSGYDRAVSRRGGLGTYAWVDVDPSRFADLVQRTVQAGTWNSPTLAIFAKLAEQQHSSEELASMLTNRRRFVLALSQGGAKLIAGTDAGIDVVYAAAIHDELREFVAAGLTPYQALRAATIDAAEYLGVAGLGTVTVGAPAELLLLDGDPLASIDNTRRLSGLVIRGTWYSATSLGALR
jgi:imidazolonepropionase-like amidohydrolase